MGFHGQARVFDFASYTFDISISNIFMTLVSGGCLCVPSEEERKYGFAESIQGLNANMAHLTPSVARSVAADVTQPLDTVLLIGEPMRQSDIRLWPASTRVTNTYGPSECSPISTIEHRSQDGKDISIGYGAGAVTWVVDSDDVNQLIPIGAVGELCIEGPILGRGYLHDKEKTAAAFIENPRWLTQGAAGYPGRRGRIYKTGDLVRYNEDGSLVCIGRKDTQTKIRGQRVELGDIESHTLACVPNTVQVVAEVITPSGDDASPTLAAFLVQADGDGKLKNGTHQGSAGSGNGDGARIITLPAAVKNAMAEQLPSYMIPAVFFAIDSLPMTSSGKTDRKKLRTIGAGFSARELRQGARRRNGTSYSKSESNGLCHQEREVAVWAGGWSLQRTRLKMPADMLNRPSRAKRCFVYYWPTVWEARL